MTRTAKNNNLFEEYNKNRSPKVKNALIVENGGLIRELIRRKFNYPNQYEDLYQEGLIALSNCIEKYNPERGATLSSFAYIAVRNHLINYLIKHGKHKEHDELSEKLVSQNPSMSYDSFAEILASVPAPVQESFKRYLSSPTKKMRYKEARAIKQVKALFKKDLF